MGDPFMGNTANAAVFCRFRQGCKDGTLPLLW